MDGIHDMGGMAGFGPVDVAAVESGHEGWEARLQVVALLSGGMSRAGIEEIPPDQYLAAGYAERWVSCSETRLLRRGVVDESDLERWREAIVAEPGVDLPNTADATALADLESMVLTTTPMRDVVDARFAPGDRVRVRRMRPEVHHRCPRYIRGAVGTIERVPGAEHVPGARPGDESLEPVYTVMFDSTDLWGDQQADGEAPFELLIDLWESYLEVP